MLRADLPCPIGDRILTRAPLARRLAALGRLDRTACAAALQREARAMLGRPDEAAALMRAIVASPDGDALETALDLAAFVLDEARMARENDQPAGRAVIEAVEAVLAEAREFQGRADLGRRAARAGCRPRRASCAPDARPSPSRPGRQVEAVGRRPRQGVEVGPAGGCGEVYREAPCPAGRPPPEARSRGRRPFGRSARSDVEGDRTTPIAREAAPALRPGPPAWSARGHDRTASAHRLTSLRALPLYHSSTNTYWKIANW